MNPHGPQQDKMHPHDMRNLILFIVASIAIWLAYDYFIMKPKMEAYRQAQAIRAAQETPAALALRADRIKDTIRPRESVIADGERLSVDTPEIMGTVALQGSRLDDLSLKQYTHTQDGTDHVAVLSPAGTDHPRYVETGWIGANLNVPDQKTIWRAQGGTRLAPGQDVTLTWDNGAGLVFERRLSIDDQFMVTVTQTVRNNSGAPVALAPYALVSQHGVPPLDAERDTSFHGAIGYVGEELHEIHYADLQKNPQQSFAGTQGWAGFSEHYWLVSLIPPQEGDKQFRFTHTPNPDLPDRPYYQTDIAGTQQVVAAGQTLEQTFHVFAGAKKARLLDEYSDKLGIKHFDLAVDFGMLYFLTKPFYWLLTLYSGLVGNFGIAILMMTLTVRTCVFPLANTSYKTFAKLKKVAPQMNELKVKYGDDKAKMQQELVKLYQTEKVNPMAGCLPILVQIPIFFALYKVLSIAIEMRHAPFFGWIQDLSLRDPTSVFNLFGLLPYDVPGFLEIGVWPCLMLCFMLIQKQMNPPPTDPIQKTMMDVFPFVITIMLAKFPSGLVIYWTASNLFSIIQQYVIMRSMGVEVRFWGHAVEAPPVSVAIEGEILEKNGEETNPVAPATPPKPKKKKKK